MALLIDTSVLFTLERRGRDPGDLATVVHGESTALAAITASELLAGVHRTGSIERRTRREAFVESLLEQLTIVGFDLVAARVHARIWAELSASGRNIGPHDLIIASTAIAYGYSVLTDNLREFHRVPGLEVHQPRW
ncbi:MAG: PIN domain-containing protein [Chloroflexi bacterium]|nr:PIN domain-containing protein [Chloroflexota bacterium]